MIDRLKDPETRALVIRHVNRLINIPILSEGIEAILIGAVYDVIVWSIDRAVPMELEVPDAAAAPDRLEMPARPEGV